jgi:polar amino acid transport system substrate-binding protein
MSVAARIPELQQGHVDVLAATLAHNKERESQVDFALTHLRHRLEGHGARCQRRQRAAAAGRQEGRHRQAAAPRKRTSAAVPTATVVTFENTQQAFQALQQGKGIAYVNDESSLMADYGKLGPAGRTSRSCRTASASSRSRSACARARRA